VLYLAEIQKKGGLLGGSNKADLRLLACQRSEERWQALANEQIVPFEKAADYNHGALVMVDLSNNNQVQRIQEASRPLLTILQNYSRLQDKLKAQEEEVEQWKESLTFQTQELARREVEMEARLEQMHDVGEQSVAVEQQRQEAMAIREEAQRLRGELEAKNQALENALAKMRSDMENLESQRSQVSGGSLNPEQLRGIEEHLNQLSSTLNSDDHNWQGSVHQGFDTLNAQQGTLDHHWQQLEAYRGQLQSLQAGFAEQAQSLKDRWQAWHDRQLQLEIQKAGEDSIAKELKAKQDHLAFLQTQLKSTLLMRQQITQLGGGLDPEVSKQVDQQALETMSLDDLDSRIHTLHQEYERVFAFVNDQEEELHLQQDDVNALRDKIASASEYDRLSLENDLADAQDTYRVLDSSMVDQRRTLNEKSAILKEHKKAQARRRGQAPLDGEATTLDVAPLLTQLERDSQKHQLQIQTLEAQVQSLEQEIQAASGNLSDQLAEHGNQREALAQEEESLKQQHRQEAELQAQVVLYEAFLHPIQENLNGLRHKLEDLNNASNQVQALRGHQLQQVDSIRATLMTMAGQPA
jgi:chromosome segregation ATPase